MKKQLTAALMAATILFTTIAAYAETGTVTAGVLNVREMPYSTVIGQLTYGQNVTVIGCDNGWYQIQYGERTAYIYGDYVSITPAEAVLTDAVASRTGQDVVAYAKNFIGVPYRYGGSTPSGFDCSGFVGYVYKNFGISLPRTSYSQMRSGYAVSVSEMLPGDLIFFRSGGHVGIYVGDNMYIHAPSTGRSVSIDPLTRDITAIRRVL